MTEKRFKGGQGKISVVGENLIFNLLSLIAKENQELRTKNNAYIQDVEAYREENTHLKLENELLKKQIEEYTNPDKYILIKKTESSTEEYNSCPDCQNIMEGNMRR